MKTPFELRTAGIRNALEEIADRDYQWKVWTGQIPSVDSDDGEVLCRLYNDYAFLEEDGYLDEAQSTDEQKKVANEFKKLTDEYAKVFPIYRPAGQVIDDPVWVKVREGAQKLLPILFPEDAARYARGQWHEEEANA